MSRLLRGRPAVCPTTSVALLLSLGFVYPSAQAPKNAGPQGDEFDLADVVVRGLVMNTTSEYGANQSLIISNATLQVLEVLKGSGIGSEIVIQFYGGTWQDVTQSALGVPSFWVDEEVLAYLTRDQYGIFRPLSGDGLHSKVTLSYGPSDPGVTQIGSEGYRYSGMFWGSMPVVYYINYLGTPDTGLAFGAVQAGFLSWEDLTAAYVYFSYGGPIFFSPSGHWDGYSIVGWVYNLPSSVIGVTTCRRYLFSSNIVECDMELNDNFLWGVMGEPNRYDVQNVATHEAGHYLRLQDLYGNSDGSQTMYGYISFGETIKRTLDWGDDMGCRLIYPYDTTAFNVGDLNSGVGTDVTFVDHNNVRDMVVAWADNPSGPNPLRWRAGYSISSIDGRPITWSTTWQSTWTMGDWTDGLGLGAGLVDSNPSTDLIVVWIDDFASGPSLMRYRVGWNILEDASVPSWSEERTLTGYIGTNSIGVGAAIFGIGGSASPDLVIFWIDRTDSAVVPYYRIGWDLNTSGHASSWTDARDIGFRPGVSGPAFGAGLALADLDGSGRPEFIIAYENGFIGGWSNSNMKLRIGWDVSTAGNPLGWSREFAVGRDNPTMRGGFGLGAAPLYRWEWSTGILVAGIVPQGWPDESDDFHYRWG